MISRRAFVLASAAAATRGQERPPNIVLVMTDDQGWWDVAAHGNPAIETPALDGLARQSVRFHRFYVSPVCAPTRASLMTGRHYLRTGVYNTRFGGDTMDDGEVTLAEALRSSGYYTGLFGKWHLGRYARYHPRNRGFDEALSFSHGHLERYTHPNQLEWQGTPVEARGHVTDVIADASRSFVMANRHRPFFLYTAFNAPHLPLYAPDEWAERYVKKGLSYRDAHIYGMVSHVDAAIGRLLATIDQAGLRDNTVVVFLCDNGGVSRHFNAGLRGAKATAFEGGVRSPLFVRWPGRFPSREVNQLAAHVDLFPTLCDVAGAKPPPDRKIDGESLLARLRGQDPPASPGRRVYHIWDRHRPTLESNWAIGEQRYKLVKNQLFDLEADPGEKNDIAAKHPGIAARLRREFEAWFADVTAGKKFEPVAIETGRDDENPVEIQASWAKLTGQAQYTFLGYDWDSVEHLASPQDRARWRLDVKRAGRYEVTASYALAAQEGTARLRVGTAEADVRNSGGPNVFARRILGTVELRQGEQWIEASASSASLALNRFWLRRA